MSFDAGALLFKIQTQGAAENARAQKEASEAFDKTGAAAGAATEKVNAVGAATDNTGKRARDAKKPLDDQAKATEEVGKQSDESSKKQDKQTASAEKQAETAKKLSAVMLVAGAAVGAMVTLSVAKWAEFDQQMSNTSAAIMATAEESRELSEAALEAGADTAYSATEAAAAQEELAKAGQSVAQIIGGSLTGALALAAAGQLQVARSAELMATTLTQFRLPAEQASHVADVLAAGAGKAQGSVEDLGLAMTYVGPLATSLGWSLEETAGTIAYFATQGIIGEKAGTSLRGVLAALQAPSAKAAEVMREYGINVYDANGKMLSAAGIADQFKTKLGGLTDQERQAALGRIFGNESLLAATLLYEGGAAAVEEWTDAVDDSGYAAEQARKRQDNLAGDIEKLGGAFDTALIRSGSNANDVLRTMVQALTAVVDVYGEAPAPVQATGMAVGVAAAAFFLAGGAAVGLKVKFVELKAQMDLLNMSMGKTALLGGAAGIALTGVVTVVALLAVKYAEARQRAEQYGDTLDKTTGKITKSTRELAVQMLQTEKSFLWMSRGSALDAAEKLGVSLDTVTDAALGNKDAAAELSRYVRILEGDQESLQKVMDETGLTQLEVVEAADVLITGIRQQSDAIDEATRKQKQANKVTDEAADTAETAAGKYLAEAGAVEELNDELQQLIDKINEANGNQQDAISANASYRAALAGISEEVARQRDEYVSAGGALESFNLSLDENTVAGSANASMLADVAKEAQDAAEAQLEVDRQTMSGRDAAEKYAATLAEQRAAFEESAVAAGFNADEVKRLADRVFALPTKREIEVIANTQSAQDAIDQFIAANASKRVNIAVGPGGTGGITQADGGIVKFFANGGEHHVAQIAKAGTYRVWAEPETGGEAYIPLAAAKRDRSTRILGEVADQFGYQLVPKNTPAAPAGGGSRPGTGPAVFHLYDVNRQLIGTMQGIAAGEVDAAFAEDDARWRGGEKSP